MIYNKVQEKIAKGIHPTSNMSNWEDWKWHIKNSIRTIEQFEKLTGIVFDEYDRKLLNETTRKFPLSITPYYLSLIDRSNYHNDPVFKQAMADSRELIIDNFEMKDPLSEEKDSPVEGITHRYPDRVLFHVSNICAMYCRHCTRKRKVGDRDFIPGRDQLKEGIEYIRNNKEIRGGIHAH